MISLTLYQILNSLTNFKIPRLLPDLEEINFPRLFPNLCEPCMVLFSVCSAVTVECCVLYLCCVGVFDMFMVM